MAKMDDWLEKDKLILLEGWSRSGLTMEQIANNMGIDDATLYRWKNKSGDICKAIKKGKEVVDFEVENALLKNALNGNVTAQIFWLKNRKKHDWREKVNIENEVSENGVLADLVEAIKDAKKS
jgi:transposase-like protein